jgi:hypothetical protein
MLLLLMAPAAAAVPIACSKFSADGADSTVQDGAPPSDAGGAVEAETPRPDATADATARPRVQCPTAAGLVECGSDEVCCHPNADNGGACIAARDCAPPETFACSSFGDCDAPLICCASRDTSRLLTAYCRPSCGADESTLCDPRFEQARCAAFSLSCSASTYRPTSYFLCR